MRFSAGIGAFPAGYSRLAGYDWSGLLFCAHLPPGMAGLPLELTSIEVLGGNRLHMVFLKFIQHLSVVYIGWSGLRVCRGGGLVGWLLQPFLAG